MIRFLVLLLTLLLPVAAQAQTAQEERDRTFLSGLIEDALSGVSREVRIDGFRGALSSEATVRRLSIADAEGEWLVAEDLTLVWTRSALLEGRIEVDRLTAGTIRLIRAPLSEPDLPTPEAVPFALPELPVSVNIGQLSAAAIIIGAPLLGEEVTLTLEGSVSLAGGEGTARIAAERQGGTEGRLTLDGGFSNATRVLALTLDLTEGPGGIAAHLLGLPGDPAVALSVQGLSPIDSFDADLRLATDGVDRVTGNFTLGTTSRPGGQPERSFTLDLAGDVTPLLAPDYRDFFGTAMTVSVNGRREADGTFDLAALSVNAQAVRLAGQGRFTPGGWPENFSLSGDLGLPDGAPVRLPVSGDPLTVTAMDLSLGFDADAGDSWSGDFILTGLQGPGYGVPRLTLTGGGTIRPAAADLPGAFVVDLVYAATGLTLDDPAMARALGTEIRGELRAGRDGGSPLRLDALTVEGPGLSLQAAATVEGPQTGLAYEATVQLSAAEMARFGPLTGLDLGGAAVLTLGLQGVARDRTFALSAEGTTRDLTIGIAAVDALTQGEGRIAFGVIRDATGLQVDGLRLTTPALTGTAAVTLSSNAGTGTFDLALDDAGRILSGLSGPARLSGSFGSGAETGLSLTTFAVIPGATADLTARRPAGETDTTLDLVADVPDLGAFAGLAGLPLTGSAGATVAGTLGEGGAFDLALTLETATLATGQPVADRLLAGPGRISTRLTGDGAGRIAAEGLRVTTAALDGNGSVTRAGDRTEASFALTVTESGLLAQGLTGPATVMGTLARDGAGQTALDLWAGVVGATATLTGTLTPDAAFAGRATMAAPDLSTLAALNGQPLRGAATLTAEGRVAADLSALDLTLAGSTADLDAGIAALAPLLAGDGQIAGRIRRDGTGPFEIEGLSLATPALQLAADGQTDGSAGDLSFRADLTDAGLIAPGLQGPASAEGTAARGSDGRLTADLSATAPGTALTLTAATDGADPMAGLTAQLTLSAADLAPFSALAGRPLSGAVTLNAAGRATLSDGTLTATVDATTRDLNPGQADLARLLAGQGTLAGRIERTAAGLILARDLRVAFPNLTATGRIEGTTATFDARLRDVGLFTPDFSGPATATGTARMGDDGGWTVDAALTGPGGATADLAGTVSAAGRLDLTARGQAPLGLANGFIEPRRLTGTADFDLRLAGPATLDALSGTVRIAGATLSAPTLRIGLTDLGGAATLAAGRASLDLAAAVQDGGRLAISGGLGLTGGLSADLTLTATDVVLRDPTLYDTTATGTVRITGPLTGGASIAGTIDLGPTELQIPSSGVGGLGDLPPVLHIGAPGDVAQTLTRAGLTGEGREPAASGGGGAAYALDLTIRAPARVFIRGRGLDAELGGSLRIGGTTAQIVPAGGLSLIRGRLDILQQRFTLTEGRADVQGDFIPWLRLVAETRARTGTDISIIVEGPATEPEVSFRSSPELPQDEVLAQLLFGRDLSQVTPLQAVQLAAAVGTLAGRGGGGIIAGLRTELGLDDFDVVTDDGGDAALRVGKYLGENVYTDVTIGQDETAVNLNLDLTRDITVTGGVTSAGETTLGIFFERDY